MHSKPFEAITAKLHPKTKNRVSKQTFFAKSPFKNRNFNELDIFRKQVIQGHTSVSLEPYTHKKKSVWIYRTIFLTFAFLFGLLGVTTMSVPTALAFGFFSISTTLKGLITTLCTVLALSSFLLGITMRTDREAVIHCLENARRTLKTHYIRKKVQLGLMRYFTIFGPQRRQAKALHHMYQDVWEKMNDKKEDALHFIARISSTHSIDKEHKELLLNQTIAELHDNLMDLAHAFRHASPSID